MHGSGARAGGGPGHTASPGPLPSPASSFGPGGICAADGWCWYAPLPSGDYWWAVGGAGRTDLWIGGEADNLLHFDGGRWRLVASPLDVRSIWAASEDDVWFVGSAHGTPILVPDIGVIAHWDGRELKETMRFGDGRLNEVWGSGPRDVYATGFPMLQHWDGHSWSSVPGVTGSSVSGSGPNDVWVGGGDGMFHFDGTTWSLLPELAGVAVGDVSVVAPNEVWALTIRGDQVVEHFDGSAWTVSLQTPPGIGFSDIRAVSRDDVWLVGGTGFASSTTARGVVRHFDGSTWSSELRTSTFLTGVDSTAGLGVVAVGPAGGIVRLIAEPAPTVVDLRVGPAGALRATAGTSPTDMWAVGDEGAVVHYDGRAVVSVPSGTTADLTDVWTTAPDDVWAVGKAGTILHYDGNAFTGVATPFNVDLRAVFGASRDDVWIGGDTGVIAHWGGSSFTPAPLPGVDPRASIYDLHGLAGDDVWLAGGAFVADDISVFTQGFVSHFDGTAWSPVEVLTFPRPSGDEPVVRVWALAPNDVWALTDRGAFGQPTGLWHFDGTTWSDDFPLGSPAAFMFPVESGSGTFAFGPHDRWRVGAQGLWQRNLQ